MKIITKRDRKNDLDAVGKCDDCNREVELAGLVNTCECGANYSGCGYRQVDNPDYWSGESRGQYWEGSGDKDRT
jgi:hypothetical protein